MRAATRQLTRLLLGLLILLPAAGALAQDTPLKLGYVDMKRLLDEAPQVRAARERLQAEFADRDAALEAQQARLERLRAALEEDRPRLGAAELQRRQQEVDVLAGSMRRARERLQAELKTRSSQELDRSWAEVSNAAVEYARSHGYDLLVPSPVIYASPRADVTDAVLQELRAGHAGAGRE